MQASFAEAPSPTLRSHLAGVPGTEWAFWKWVGLRSSGFPAQNVLKLAASEELEIAARKLEAALTAKDAAFDNAVFQVNVALDDLKQSGNWESKEVRGPLLKARRKLEAKQLPANVSEIDSLDSIRALRACIERGNELRASFDEAFLHASMRTSQVISEFASCDRFCEAIIWQNRKLVHEALRFLRGSFPGAGERNSRRRQHEEVVATYLQRYCMKNDTIGFFGPVGWAKFVPDGEHLTSTPGAELIATRRTYWEAWAIEKLAAILAQKPGLLHWILLATMPFVRLEGTTLLHPVLGLRELTPAQAAVVRCCNGGDRANQIAAKLLQLPERPLQSEADVYACLDADLPLASPTTVDEMVSRAPFAMISCSSFEGFKNNCACRRYLKRRIAVVKYLSAATYNVRKSATIRTPALIHRTYLGLELSISAFPEL